MDRSPARLCRLLALSAAVAALALAANTAAAQYQWRDASGRMVFSDVPPPASVAPERIVTAPARRDAPPSPGAVGAGVGKAGAAPVATAGAGAADTNQTLADRELAYRKRLAERAEQEKKAQEATRTRQEMAKACADTQADIRSLESGQRISRINADGEREFISDAERSDRLKSARKTVGERC